MHHLDTLSTLNAAAALGVAAFCWNCATPSIHAAGPRLGKVVVGVGWAALVALAFVALVVTDCG